MTKEKPKPKEPFNSAFPVKAQMELWRQRIVAANKPKADK